MASVVKKMIEDGAKPTQTIAIPDDFDYLSEIKAFCALCAGFWTRIIWFTLVCQIILLFLISRLLEALGRKY